MKNFTSNLIIRLFMLICLVAVNNSTFAQQSGGISINDDGSPPDSSAMLDVQSAEKGFLPPRMTMTERDGITNPAEGLQIFNTTTNCPNYFSSGHWYELCGVPPALFASLDCAGAILNGSLMEGVTTSSESLEIEYVGGNGGIQYGQTISSTGVTGLTLTLSAGNIALGDGTLIYDLSGTPANSGIATFDLNIGGHVCILDLTVSDFFLCGTSTVTFSYNNNSVTYGTVEGQNGTCWLDRNLGASQVATASNDPDSYGDLFQWGRLDDGHQERTSGTTITLSNNDIPGHDDFIVTSSNPHDWRNPQNNNLWQGENGINNPCPSGFRLPTNVELNNERLSWSSNSQAGAFNSPLKWTTGGYRFSNGLIYSIGSLGYYWSSTVTAFTTSRNLQLSSNPNMDSRNRAWGMSVRCIKD